MKRILIATPCYSGLVHMAYMTSVLKVMQSASSRGYVIDLCQISDSLVTRARNNIVAVFLDGSWDRLFWIDADIGFEPDQFFRLVDLDRDIVAAAYPLKTYRFPPQPTELHGDKLRQAMLRFAVSLPAGKIPMPEDGFIAVKEAATGFMCIDRTVLEAMKCRYPELRYRSDQEQLGAPESANHYLFFDTMVEEQRYLSEDYAFCRRAQLAGYSVWLDIRGALSHTGPHEFAGSLLDTIRLQQS